MDLLLKNNNFERYKRTALNTVIEDGIPSLSGILNVPFFISSSFDENRMQKEIKKIKEAIYSYIIRPFDIQMQSKGYILDYIDMKWTLSNKQIETDPCFDDLKLAVKLADSPFFFVALLEKPNEKYAPNVISQDYMEELKQWLIQSNDDLSRLVIENYYELDENSTPAEYVLKYESDVRVSNKSKIVKKKLQQSCLDKIYEICPESEYKRYLNELKNDNFNVIEYRYENCLQMNIILMFFIQKNLNHDEFLNNVNTLYSNINNDEILRKSLSDQAMEFLIKTREKLKINDLSVPKIFQNTLESSQTIESKNFLNVSQQFNEITQFFIDVYHKNHSKFIQVLGSDYLELLHHVKFCQSKINTFVSRDNLLKTAYGACDLKQFNVFYGYSGSGKTSLMCKIAQYLHSSVKNSECILIVRFIGTSQQSYNIQDLLKSILKQLIEILGDKLVEKKIDSISKLYKYFKESLHSAAVKHSEKKFLLVLDSLDQLSDDYNAKALEWLPIDLPENFKIILSTLRDVNDGGNQAYNSLIKIMRQNFQFNEIPELQLKEIESIMAAKLNKTNRRLQKDQYECLVRKFSTCKSPLFLKILIDKALTWKSYSIYEDSINTVDQAIEEILEKMEKNYEKAFVTRVLKYITITKYGLDITQLVKVLSRDEKMLDFIARYFGSNVQDNQIATLFLMQLIYDLREYLNGPRYQWYHRKFDINATERYCDRIRDKKDNEQCNYRLSNVFAQYKYVDRFWMRNLPYYMANAGDIKALLQEYLLDIEFIQTKIHIIGMDEMLNDYKLAEDLLNENDYGSLKIVYHTLNTAASCLRNYSFDLPGQILGRLYDCLKAPEVLLDKCKIPFSESIIPNKRFMCSNVKQYPIYKNAGIFEIKSVLVDNRNDYLIATAFDDNTINFYLKNDNNSLSFQLMRKFKNTNKLLTSLNPASDILYCWSSYDEKPKIDRVNDIYHVVEAFNIADRTFEFSIKLTNHEFSTYKNVLISNYDPFNAYCDTEIIEHVWIVTKDCWYDINKENKIKIKLKHKREDDQIICCANYGKYLYYGFNNDSMVYKLEAATAAERIDFSNGIKTVIERELSSKIKLNDELITGEKFLVSIKNKQLIVSSKKERKLPYVGFNNENEAQYETEFFIHFLSLNNLEMEHCFSISASYDINLYKLEDNFIYATSFDSFLLINIETQIIERTFEHGVKINDCFVTNEERDQRKLIVACESRLCFWKDFIIDNSMIIKSDCDYSSQNILFFYDIFDSRVSPLVIIYNVFDNRKNNQSQELILIYDLFSERVIREIRLNEKTQNDYQPVAVFSNRCYLFYQISTNTYLLFDFDFKIIDRIKSAQQRIFKRLSNDKFIMAVEFNQRRESLFYFDFSIEYSFKSFKEANDVPTDNNCLQINLNSIIYKTNDNRILIRQHQDFERIYKLSFELSHRSIKTIGSDDGKFVAVLQDTDNHATGILKIYRVDEVEPIVTINSCTENFKFVDSFLIYQVRDSSNYVTYVKNLENASLKLNEWFRYKVDYDEMHIMKINYMNNGCRGGYHLLWCEVYFVKNNQSIKGIHVINLNELQTKAFLNTNEKLKYKQIALFDHGNCLIGKVQNELKFVLFSVASMKHKSKTIIDDSLSRIEFKSLTISN